MANEFNNVTRPHGYNHSPIEAIDAARAMCQGWYASHTLDPFKAHCLLNAFKYIWRSPIKGSFDENIRKAIWYLRMAIDDDPRKEREE
jgi:hypothetical protein